MDMDEPNPFVTNSDTVQKSDDSPPDCTDLKPCEDLTTNYESPDKKRKLSATESIPKESIQKKIAFVDQAVLNIDILPKEILIMIFGKLSHNELGHIAQVNKMWNELSRCPLLWRRVNAQFRWRDGSQNEVAIKFLQNFPVILTHLELDFQYFYPLKWKDRLKIGQFCRNMRYRCPSLKALILHGVHFSVCLQSVIDLCNHCFPNLEVLSLRYSDFTEYSISRNFRQFSKLNVLEFFYIWKIGDPEELTLQKLPYLTKMSIVDTEASNYWFQKEASCLRNLEVLNLQWTDVNSETFTILKNYALKLTELYLCGATMLRDEDFIFRDSVFPVLKTICLSRCYGISSDGIVSLVMSCPSLQNVYVNRPLVLAYEDHPFVVDNVCELETVKIHVPCHHFRKNYFYE